MNYFTHHLVCKIQLSIELNSFLISHYPFIGQAIIFSSYNILVKDTKFTPTLRISTGHSFCYMKTSEMPTLVNTSAVSLFHPQLEHCPQVILPPVLVL